jgi:putative ABC transport system permease protein
MKTLWQDLRFGLRTLRKSPGFTAIAVLTLALGIGANTAFFTVVYGVLLRPLPFHEPDRLVQLAETYKDRTEEAGMDMRQFLRLRQYSRLFDNITGYTAMGYNLAAGNGAEHLFGMPVSANYFRSLGIVPEIGRDFTDADDHGSGQPVAIVSHGLWVRRLAGNANDGSKAEPPSGQTILLNGEPFTVIGVMPRDFSSLGQSGAPDSSAPDIWTPLALVANGAGSGGNISVLGRLRPGVTRGELAAQMAVVTQDLKSEYARGRQGGPAFHLSFLPYQQMIGAEVRPFLLVLLGAIGFVLLIACANVANLLVARATGRGREIAVRVALGASKSRIVRKLLTESLLIALAGGALGFVIAAVGGNLLLALAPIDLPRAADVHLDLAAFAFTLFVSLFTGALFGVAPALDAVRSSLDSSLKEGADRSGSGRGRPRLRHILITADFAMSLVLLTGAGLMIATFTKLLHADPGFNPHPVLSMQFWLVGSKYNSSAEIARFYQEVQRRIEAVPGVQATGIVAAGLPLERGGNNGVRIAGPDSGRWLNTDYREVTPGYFRALGIPLRQGREFAASDDANANRVVVVNESFVRKNFPGRNALGEHLYVTKTECEIIGIAGDVKSYMDEPAPPTTFVPTAQASFLASSLFEGWFPRSIVVRAAVDPLGLSRVVREAVASVDSTIPTGRVRSMVQVLSRSLALRNFMRVLLSFFAALALLLASVGIYGVISYAVSQRTREIGVRVALGAQPADVLRIVLGEGLKLILTGAALGLAASFALTKFLGALLFNVSATDPAIFALGTALLVGVALAACYIPARRATRVDPIVALRYE